MLDTTALRDEFAPPRPRGVGKSVALALLVHVGLVGLLALGVNWKSDPQTTVYDAEIWDMTPSQEGGPKGPAAPAREAETRKEANTAGADEAIRVAREQQARETAQQAATQRQQQAAERRQLAEEQQQQAQERERAAQQRAEQTRQAREQEAEIALRKREAEKQKQLQAERQAREQAAKDKAREQQEARAKAQQDAKAAAEAKADAAARSKAEAAAKAQAAKEAAAKRDADAARKAQLDRMRALAGSAGGGDGAGASGGKGTTGSGKDAKSRGGPSSGYAAKVRAKVRPNITYNDDEGDSPRTDVEVRAAPDGTITARRIIRSSGNRSWDQAVLRAIDKTDTLPKDIDGSVPSPIVIEFRLR